MIRQMRDDERTPDHNERVTMHPTKGVFDTSRAEWRRADGGVVGAGLDADNGSRIEIAFVDDLVGMRDSADPEGPVLVFTQAEWDAFVGGVTDGEFDL